MESVCSTSSDPITFDDVMSLRLNDKDMRSRYKTLQKISYKKLRECLGVINEKIKSGTIPEDILPEAKFRRKLIRIEMQRQYTLFQDRKLKREEKKKEEEQKEAKNIVAKESFDLDDGLALFARNSEDEQSSSPAEDEDEDFTAKRVRKSESFATKKPAKPQQTKIELVYLDDNGKVLKKERLSNKGRPNNIKYEPAVEVKSVSVAETKKEPVAETKEEPMEVTLKKVKALKNIMMNRKKMAKTGKVKNDAYSTSDDDNDDIKIVTEKTLTYDDVRISSFDMTDPHDDLTNAVATWNTRNVFKSYDAMRAILLPVFAKYIVLDVTANCFYVKNNGKVSTMPIKGTFLNTVEFAYKEEKRTKKITFCKFVINENMFVSRVVNKKNQSEVKQNEFNIFQPWRAKLVETFDEKQLEAIRLFKELIFLNWASERKDLYNYILSWFHDLLTKKRTNIAMCMKSREGCGKGTIIEFFREYIMNPHMVQMPPNLETICGDFQDILSGTCLVAIDECNEAKSEMRKHFNKMKNYIVTDSIEINPKGRTRYSIDNMCSFILFTNEEAPLLLSRTDRRYFVNEMHEHFMNDFEYFKNFRDVVFNDRAGDAVYTMLMNKKIEDFEYVNIHSIPETDIRTELMENDIPAHVKYMDDLNNFVQYKLTDADESEDEVTYTEDFIGYIVDRNGAYKVSRTALFTNYDEYCKRLKLYAGNSDRFFKKIKNCMEIATIKGKRYYKLNTLDITKLIQ